MGSTTGTNQDVLAFWRLRLLWWVKAGVRFLGESFMIGPNTPYHWLVQA
jgi:hypothetical protein